MKRDREKGRGTCWRRYQAESPTPPLLCAAARNWREAALDADGALRNSENAENVCVYVYVDMYICICIKCVYVYVYMYMYKCICT